MIRVGETPSSAWWKISQISVVLETPISSLVPKIDEENRYHITEPRKKIT
jgi:hypothetical protein